MQDDIRDKRLKSREEDNEPSFVPPEVVAEEDEVVDMAEVAKNEKPKTENKDKKPKSKGLQIPPVIGAQFSKLKLWWSKLSKKQRIIYGAIAAGVLIGLVLGGVMLLKKDQPVQQPAKVVKKEEVKEPPKPTTEPSRLTGVQVAPEFNLLPVTGIMIENSPDARPQSGLNQAGVVFEAIAEGGITRFLTLFQEAQPDYVGPVRSVRPYYLQWLQGFDAPVAHVGGSADALAKIRNEGIKDLDQFHNGGPYQRVSNRYAPHNVYTSLGALIALEKSKGWTSSTFTGFERKAAEQASAAPTAKAIDFDISGPLYNVHYDYDAATNSYKRSMAGIPHKDERSGAQLNPKVVVALVMSYGIHPNGVNSNYGTIGSGTVYIFQDGIVTQGTWTKGSDKEQFKFTDAAGAVIGLNPGQTWLTALGATTDVTYTP